MTPMAKLYTNPPNKYINQLIFLSDLIDTEVTKDIRVSVALSPSPSLSLSLSLR